MSADRYEITEDAWGEPLINGSRAIMWSDTALIGAIRQQARDIAELEVLAEIGRQWNTDSSLAKWFPLTAERVEQDAQEIAKLRADLAAAVAERDDYRDELSGLCHTLSVGSEGRPEMTAADWRKRVDQGIDFLTRPLLSRIEATDKELAKRSSMLDICTQNCSDWVGKWRAEQERAERAEARLAAIDGAPVVAKTLGNDHMHVNRGVARRLLIGTELIARPAKD